MAPGKTYRFDPEVCTIRPKNKRRIHVYRVDYYDPRDELNETQRSRCQELRSFMAEVVDDGTGKAFLKLTLDTPGKVTIPRQSPGIGIGIPERKGRMRAGGCKITLSLFPSSYWPPGIMTTPWFLRMPWPHTFHFLEKSSSTKFFPVSSSISKKQARCKIRYARLCRVASA